MSVSALEYFGFIFSFQEPLDSLPASGLCQRSTALSKSTKAVKYTCFLFFYILVIFLHLQAMPCLFLTGCDAAVVIAAAVIASVYSSGWFLFFFVHLQMTS